MRTSTSGWEVGPAISGSFISNRNQTILYTIGLITCLRRVEYTHGTEVQTYGRIIKMHKNDRIVEKNDCPNFK